MVGYSWQQNTERRFEAGGSCPRETHADDLHSLRHLRPDILTITRLHQDLLEVPGNRDLLDAPVLNGEVRRRSYGI